MGLIRGPASKIGSKHLTLLTACIATLLLLSPSLFECSAALAPRDEGKVNYKYKQVLNLQAPISEVAEHGGEIPELGVSSSNSHRRRQGRTYGSTERRRKLASGILSADSWYQGTLVITIVSPSEGEDDLVVYLLRLEGSGRMLELVVSEAAAEMLQASAHVKALGIIDEEGRLVPAQLFQADVVGGRQLEGDEKEEDYGAADEDAGFVGDGIPVAQLWGVPWTQDLVVKDVSVLIMVADICGKGAAATVEKDYYSSVPTASTNDQQTLKKWNFHFTTDDCSMTDVFGWHNFAQAYARDTLGIDIDKYKHRLLLMPAYFTYSSGCPWLGLGTLGPTETWVNGSFRSSQVWLSGENWQTLMTYMHEIGHTNYLHHAVLGRCEYCDYTCVMGGGLLHPLLQSTYNW
eukprot:gene19491-26154_t